ncbi:MAG: phytanoyl-CoA dioxygenase family protein [Pseudomonadota bacterium]
MTDLRAEYAFDAKEADRYRQQGYLVRENVFPEDELQTLRAAADRVSAKALELASAGTEYRLDGKRFVDKDGHTVQFEFADDLRLRVVEPIHTLDPEIDALVDNPRLADPMRSILGCQHIALWTGKMNLKTGFGSGFDWHQDSPYWIHDSTHVDRLPNVMLTLEDQTEDNGCFRVVAGSHLAGILPGRADGTQLAGFYTDQTRFDLSREVRFMVPAGSLIFFNPHIVHGSAPNATADSRCAMIFTYQPGDYPLLKIGDIRNIATQ